MSLASSILENLGKTLLFEGHTDVVTEGDRDAWTYDPFSAHIVGRPHVWKRNE